LETFNTMPMLPASIRERQRQPANGSVTAANRHPDRGDMFRTPASIRLQPPYLLTQRLKAAIKEENPMKITRIRAAFAVTAACALAAGSVAMAANPMVGGAAMYPTKNIVQNAVNSKDHTTLVAAVKAAGLVDTLSGAGPFTVFAPTNAAFGRLPAGTVDSLVMPANKDQLTQILTYHVVAGRLTAAAIAAKIRAGHGTATLTTVEGEPLMARMQGKWLVLTDAKGGMSRVTIADVMQSNGVIHVVDAVLMP
jgi:uncharacterized surface protein with fasciclin (FAS1) repeats